MARLRSMWTALLLFLALTFEANCAPTLTAELDYGTFEGAYSSKYNISYWQKIPFAAPPIGQNRFRGPQAPAALTNDTYNSTAFFDMCPQRTVNGSEDCLYLGLYGRPWTVGEPLRPVVVVFFGGAYIEGDAYFTIPPAGYPTLNASSLNDYIFVYPNYRTNAFGFLPGTEIANDPNSNLNNGLLDQHAALQWTNKYISHFGGDPNQTTIWGQSAGAGSVVAQVIAQNGSTSPSLFKHALASSPFWVKTYQYDAPQAQSLYDNLARMTNCSGPNSLQCLKSVDVQTIRTASLAISNSHTYNTSSYSWAPVIDDIFLTQPLSVATEPGNSAVNIDIGWGMYNLHEGENFIPPGLVNVSGIATPGQPYFNSSEASFDGWLRGYLPGLSDDDIDLIENKYYPAVGTAETLSYNTTYVRAGLIFRDSVLACPAYWMATAAADKSYLGEYVIPPATHGADTEWWNQVNAVQQTDPVTYHGYAGAFASFFATGDPNAHKLTNSSQAGIPQLPPTIAATGPAEYGNGTSGTSSNATEFIIQTDDFFTVGIEQLETRCAFWRSVAKDIPI